MAFNWSYRTHTTRTLILAAGFAAGFLAGGWLWPLKNAAPTEPQLKTLEEKLPQISLDENLSVKESSPAAQLRVLNGRVVPIYERESQKANGKWQNDKSNVKTEATATAEPQKQVQTVRLAGLRILGEVQALPACPDDAISAGSSCQKAGSKIGNVTPILRFFDEDDQLITTKVAQWNDEFVPLASGQKQVYDVLIPDPPKSATISIEMRAAEVDAEVAQRVPTDVLKIKENKLEPGEYERKDPKTKEKIKIKYYKFSGSLVNTADFEVVSPTVYVWIKNDKNEVIGVTKKVYSTDILAPGQELAINLLVVPVAEEEVFSHEVRVLGEKL